MSTVTLGVNGRPYVVGCEDGGEDHLRALAALIDAKARQIAPQAGGPGEARLMLMAALMVADDLRAAQADLAETRARLTDLRGAFDRLEARAAAAIEAAAVRLETMASE